MKYWLNKYFSLMGMFLALQLSWCIAHVLLVSNGDVNPWKLGGYGMYTTPAYCPLPEITIEGTNYVPSNRVYSIYKREMLAGCLSTLRDFYETLLKELHQKREALAGLTIKFHHTELDKETMKAKYVSSGQAKIEINNGLVTINEELCSRIRKLTFNLDF
ncbi:hypothetical protein ACMXYN_05665 [Neptuniibacter sp. PT8_73]|uniref:hypothetical protein n=1 Tax=Neptuniibacter sp. PT8_73 TaxID=3398206 RepID=UPI0039F54EBC